MYKSLFKKNWSQRFKFALDDVDYILKIRMVTEKVHVLEKDLDEFRK